MGIRAENSSEAGSPFVAVGQPQRTTVVVAIQAVALMAVATPLTLAYGVVGSCIGVGIAFVVGLALTYRYVRRTVALSLRDAFTVPGVAAVLSMVAYLLLARGVALHCVQGRPSTCCPWCCGWWSRAASLPPPSSP